MPEVVVSHAAIVFIAAVLASLAGFYVSGMIGPGDAFDVDYCTYEVAGNMTIVKVVGVKLTNDDTVISRLELIAPNSTVVATVDFPINFHAGLQIPNTTLWIIPIPPNSPLNAGEQWPIYALVEYTGELAAVKVYWHTPTLDGVDVCQFS